MNIYDNLDIMPLNCAGWCDNGPLLCQLITDYRPRHIIEVGSWYGASAITMAKHCRDLKLKCRLTCIDTWLGALEFLTNPTPKRDLLSRNGYPQAYYQFLSNVVHERLQDLITPIPNTSNIAARYLASKNITADLIYIDGSHDYQDVLADLENYWPLTTGLLVGDDFSRSWNGVRLAVKDFVKMSQLTLETQGRTWLIRRTAKPELPA